MTESWKKIMQELQKPFDDQEIEWRPQSAFKNNNNTKVLVLPYLQGHAIQNRLDDVLGANWSDDYESIKVNNKEAFRGKLSIKVDGEWITRTDAAEVSDIESVKGGHTNAFKRVAVKFGIGRYLYNVDPVWVPLLNNNKGDIRVNGKFKINGQDTYLKGSFQRPKIEGTKGIVVNNTAGGTQQASNNQQTDRNQNVNAEQWKWIKQAEEILKLSDEYKVRIFNQANQTSFENVEQLQQADSKQLRAYCLVLKPVRNIALIPTKYPNCSLEEVISFTQTYKPEVYIQHLYSLFFNLTGEDVEKILDLAQRAHKQRQTA